MAIERLSFGGSYDAPRQDFQVETLAEIADLPTQTKEWATSKGNSQTAPTGSTAICEEDFSIWILKINGTWKEMTFGEESDDNAGEE